MNRGVFLDRDGVINDDIGYVGTREQFRFLPDIFEFCRQAESKGYLIFVVTNQAGIAKGYYTEDDYRVLNQWMLKQFRMERVHIAATYYCPFHLEATVAAYKQDSFDRKPSPGMILKAQQEFSVDVSRSLLIGDKDSDMEAGRRAGIKHLVFLVGKYPYTECADVKIIQNILEAAPLLHE